MENKNIKKRIIAWILIPVAVILAFVGGFFVRELFESDNSRVATEIIRMMEEVGYVYDKQTGEPRKITPEDIGDALVNGILDDYAEYFTPKEYGQEETERKGQYKGVGLSFYDNDSVIDVVVGNSPAYHAGVKAGDKIISAKVGENTVTIETPDEFGELVRSVQDGTAITVNLEREGAPVIVELTPSDYVASYVEYFDSQKHGFYKTENKEMVFTDTDDGISSLPSDTAYISFSSFNGSAFDQMKDALNFMKKQGRVKLILDLRNNGGGYMDILLNVASLLIKNQGKKRTVVALEKSKTGTFEHAFTENRYVGNSEWDIQSISIMANGGTASASECLIGAMAYYGQKYQEPFNLSKLVIDTGYGGKQSTFGKGIMQTTYLLLSGGALKLTTAKIYWPDNTTCIHDKGIYPRVNGEINGEIIYSNIVSSQNALAKAVEVL